MKNLRRPFKAKAGTQPTLTHPPPSRVSAAIIRLVTPGSQVGRETASKKHIGRNGVTHTLFLSDI
jgi:hypothetical protein